MMNFNSFIVATVLGIAFSTVSGEMERQKRTWSTGLDYAGSGGRHRVGGNVGWNNNNWNVRGSGWADNTGNYGFGASVKYSWKRSLPRAQDAFFLRIEANPCHLPTYDDNDDGVIALEEMRIVFPDMSLADKLFSDLDVNGQDHSKNYLSPYQTSYNRDYPLKKPLDTVAVRPMTSQGFSPQKDFPDTNYSEEFKKKHQRPITPLRPGSTSGNRANKPHPPESFLVWKFPRRSAHEQPAARWNEELTNDMINQVHRRLCQSTYQTDYMGIPQGFQVKSAYQLPPDWKENIPYTLDSIQRYCYQNHAQPPELTLPSTRYGSNRKKQLPASGTIPTASARHMHIRSRTTYDRHYNDNADAVTQQIRELGYKLGAEALRKYYDKATGEDRTMVKNILEAYSGKPVSPSPAPHPPAMSARPPSGRPPARMSYRSNTPASTPISTPYVPLPAPKAPDSKLSFSAYKAPALLE